MQTVHRLPGRVRLRIVRLRNDPFFAESLTWILLQEPAVRKARVSRDCSCLVIEFDGTGFEPISFLNRLKEDDLYRAEVRLKDGATGSSVLYRALLRMELVLSPLVQLCLGGLSLLSVLGSWSNPIKRVILIAGVVPVWNRAARMLVEERRLGGDTMDGLACTLLILEGNHLPAAAMIFLVGLGEFIREQAIKRCQRIIRYLQGLDERSAWLVRGESRVKIPARAIQPGDVLAVYAGEIVPVSGLVLDGAGTVIAGDDSSPALPEPVRKGARVTSPAILSSGKIYVRAEKRWSPPTVSELDNKILRRSLYRTEYHRMALVTGYKVVGPVLLLSSILFLVGNRHAQALTVICFDFLTGIRVALPTAILASLYRAGKLGILIKNARAVETLASADTFIFSLSGSITTGQGEVVDVLPLSTHPRHEIIRLAAAVESRYHHPVAGAITKHASSQGIVIPHRTNSRLTGGYGASATVEGKEISVGNRGYLESLGINTGAGSAFDGTGSARDQAWIYVGIDGELSGAILYRDPIRRNAPDTMLQLKQLGIREIAIISGGSAGSAGAAGELTGVDRVYSSLSPDDKAEVVMDYQLKGRKVVVVGDDVSDSAAMAQADLSVSLRESADVAQYRADVVLSSDLAQIPQALRICRDAMRLSRQNHMLVSVPNWTGLFLSLLGLIGPVQGTALNNGSIVIGALNGLRPLGITDPGPFEPDLAGFM